MIIKTIFGLLLLMVFVLVVASFKTHHHSTRPQITELQKERAKEKMLAALKTVASGVLSEFTGGSTFYALTVGVYDAMSDQNTTLWLQINNFVKSTTEKMLSQYSNENLRNSLDRAEVMLNESSPNMHTYMKALGEEIYPMKYESVPWSDQLPLIIVRYVFYLVQAYQIEIEKGSIDKCSLVEPLQTVKRRTISSMHEMLRKKYRQIMPGNFSREPVESVNFTLRNSNQQFEVAVLSEGLDTEDVGIPIKKAKRLTRYRHVTYHTFKYQIENLKENTIDYLMVIVDRVNDHLNDETCLGCPNCPTPITRDDINLDWPTDCYDEENKCQHPCGRFNNGVDEGNWCWIKDHYREEEEWQECTPNPGGIRCCISLDFDASNPSRCSAKKNKAKKSKNQSSQ